LSKRVEFGSEIILDYAGMFSDYFIGVEKFGNVQFIEETQSNFL